MAVVEVVKYNGTPDMFAWKYPSEELGTWTQLIVNESQEAVLFKGGRALDVFESGRHTLSTANIPFLCNLINLPFGGRSPFTAEVWYVNKACSLDVKWGTATPIQIQDPKYGVFVPVRSFGQFGLQVTDSPQFLVKLVGTLPQLNQASLLKFFRGLYITKVKDTISSYLVRNEISILEINAYIDEISDCLKERIEPILAEYGISLVNFYVNDISIPEDDPGVMKLKNALAKRAEMDIVGYSYQQERSFDTLEGAATNPGSPSSGLMGAGLGLGLGVSAGGAMGTQFGGIAKVMNTGGPQHECPGCHGKVPADKRFCPDCGTDLHAAGGNSGAVKCSACGASLTPSTKFCPQCGSKYNPCPKCAADLPDGASACPQCGYVLPKPCPQCGRPLSDSNAKFCPECGARLTKSCPECGAAIQGAPRFCPECGGKLESEGGGSGLKGM